MAISTRTLGWVATTTYGFLSVGQVVQIAKVNALGHSPFFWGLWLILWVMAVSFYTLALCRMVSKETWRDIPAADWIQVGTRLVGAVLATICLLQCAIPSITGVEVTMAIALNLGMLYLMLTAARHPVTQRIVAEVSHWAFVASIWFGLTGQIIWAHLHGVKAASPIFWCTHLLMCITWSIYVGRQAKENNDPRRRTHSRLFGLAALSAVWMLVLISYDRITG